jgi:hypothetical protein
MTPLWKAIKPPLKRFTYIIAILTLILLVPKEKFVMISTVAVAPALALLRIGELYTVPYFPR